MNKLFLTIGIILLLVVSPISALDNQATVKQGDCLKISQTCASCSYVNISSISNRDNFSLTTNVPMDYFGNAEWRYEFCNTTFLGRYDVRGQGDIDSIDQSFATYFEVTPSGESGTENIIFYILILIFLYTINLLGFFKRNATITILGGIGLTLLGLYMVTNGIIIYRNDLTLALSYITLFWGAGSALWAGVETIQDNI